MLNEASVAVGEDPGACRLAHEASNQLRQAFRLVLSGERARLFDPLQTCVGEIGSQQLGMLELEEAILARPSDQRRSLELLQVIGRLVRQAFVNTNWLGAIERRAKPLLMSWMAGVHAPLVIEEQRLLSLWTVKTAMTVQLAQAQTQRVIPLDQYPALYKARTQPPPGFYVWLQAQDPEWKGVNVYASRPVLTDHGPAYEIRIEFRQLHLRVVGAANG